MNRLMRRLFSAVMAIAVVAVFGGFALIAQASSVTFDNGKTTEKYTFSESTEFPPSDLFTEFKGIYPGESRTQAITISNDSETKATFFLQMSAAKQDSSMTEEQLKNVWKLIYDELQIKITDANGAVIFEGGLGGERDGDSIPAVGDYTSAKLSLGALEANKSTELTVALTADAEMGNEYQALIGKVDWNFVVEIPDEIPDTGESGRIIIFIAIGVAVACAVVLVITRKQKNK